VTSGKWQVTSDEAQKTLDLPRIGVIQVQRDNHLGFKLRRGTFRMGDKVDELPRAVAGLTFGNV
jgi:hypothetical protein